VGATRIDRYREREIARRTDGRVGGQTDRQADRQTDRQIDKGTIDYLGQFFMEPSDYYDAP
jgi:hypothetical protein